MVCLPVGACPFKTRGDWGNPDGIESHILDVVQVVYDALVGTTAILAVLCVTSWPRSIRKCEPVCDKLVTFWMSAEEEGRGMRVTWYMERPRQSLVDAAKDDTKKKEEIARALRGPMIKERVE